MNTRRELLKAGAAITAGGLALPWQPSRVLAPLRADRKTKRVVLVAFAGGVRTKETFGSPANIPNLKAMADEGVLYTRMRTANLGHFGAAMSIFTVLYLSLKAFPFHANFLAVSAAFFKLQALDAPVRWRRALLLDHRLDQLKVPDEQGSKGALLLLERVHVRPSR